ncbi:Eco57I restriction-modification methylase domain-containing protein [Rhodococcus qingshengii]|uniref:Eco57I restriction-modification methylase domain-containing protein n=1 Tax=Rhodococcus qingshengii TaxID=334542 RepID=UPI000B19637F|nr:hypothetical protein [Rhodococcus qingshengii]MCZ4548187.1 hypothetical protein [Rhodococcus qingshengii]
MRLRLAMDAWCAMWFWPLTGSVEDSGNDEDNHPGPPGLDEWMKTLEGLLGADGVRQGAEGQRMFHETVERFDQLSKMDELERGFYGMRSVLHLLSKHKWLGTARRIAEEQGFLHWELDFAHIFQRGGFDLQVGNPPWVRPVWKDDITLAEYDPYFVLQEKIPESAFESRRDGLLADSQLRDGYLGGLTSWAGTAEHLGSTVEHSILAGVQTNLYTNFMERVWRNTKEHRVSGLIHPEGHFTDPKAGKLRAETYSRLRRHWQFINMTQLFEDVNNKVHYGIHIYGPPGEIGFMQASSLLDPQTIEGSLLDDGVAEVPGTQFPWGGWDLRPHCSRVAQVSRSTLAEWARLFDSPGTPASQARLLLPVTREHIEVLERFAKQGKRLADLGYRWSSLWHEKGAKQDGYIEWRSAVPCSWNEVILQGPSFTVANPLVREPNNPCKSNKDWSMLDLESLPDTIVPRTNYQRACDRHDYDEGIPQWNGRPATDYWRVAWRDMTQPGLERSLHATLLPPGAAHVHTIRSMVVGSHAIENRSGSFEPSLLNTAVIAGLWASLPYDYLIKVSGTSAVNMELVKRVPAPVDHVAYPYLLLRTLRLNCLTRNYAPLWEELYEESFETDSWAVPLIGLPDLAVPRRDWTMDTPLRTDFERRAALVEIDALAALMLGLTADHLTLMFRAQFPVLRKYEYEMYFDANGRKIAKDHHAQGVKQQKDDYKLVQAYLGADDSGDLLDRYEPFPPDKNHDEPWFYKPDREAEMRTAYAEFERRLGLNG